MKNTEEVTSGAGNKRPFTIAVEGNIGAGKSTFLEHFSKVTAVEVFPEPVAKWQNMGGQNLLELQYSDPERWSHLVQSYIQVKQAFLTFSKKLKPEKTQNDFSGQNSMNR